MEPPAKRAPVRSRCEVDDQAISVHDLDRAISRLNIEGQPRRSLDDDVEALANDRHVRSMALGLNPGAAPDDPRVVPHPARCARFRVDLPEADAVDGDVEAWLREAYERAA